MRAAGRDRCQSHTQHIGTFIPQPTVAFALPLSSHVPFIRIIGSFEHNGIMYHVNRNRTLTFNEVRVSLSPDCSLTFVAIPCFNPDPKVRVRVTEQKFVEI